MTNETRTRRLIVTLPDTAAEEVDELANIVETYLGGWGATVEVARDEYQNIQDELAVVEYDVIDGSKDRVSLVRAETDSLLLLLTKDEAQQLGAQLLRAADEIEEA